MAQKFAEAMATGAAESRTQTEHFAAELAGGKVSGVPLQLSAQLMEAYDGLASAFTGVAEALEQQMVVATAYDAVGSDAGDKEINQLT
uniref:hypothetical protein n=1 Tax=Actinokineospora sp. CA-119265 TaxID=3239890 RepID=UPI003F494B53